MSNPLTGDFEAVLQISGGTLRRLTATMHQNAFASAADPSVPHVVYLRLDDPTIPDQRGSIAAQIGVPYLQLIDGATDRFRVEFGVRARYRADPGTVPLADLIHGTVTAEYRRHDIDPRCLGWRGIAGDYFWFRVVADTVRFQGTLLNESSELALTQLLDEPQVRAHLDRQFAAVLANQFEPEPQRVSSRFRRIRSLVVGDGPADSAIALPYGLGPAAPAGDLASVGRIVLDGHDLALAVSADAITGRIQPFLDPVAGRQVDVHHEVDGGFGGGLTIDYHLRVDTAAVEWLGGSVLLPGTGVLRVRLTGVGWASRLYRSGVFTLGSVEAKDLRTTFTIDQYVGLSFNPGTEFLSVRALGAPVADVRGGPKAALVVAVVRDAVLKNAPAQLAGPLANAQATLDGLDPSASRDALVQALRSLDPAADAHFVGARFDADGVVLSGPVSLSHRRRPEVSFVRTPSGDGFDAIESWIPGGRIDRFAWTWTWFTNPVEPAPGPPGASTQEDTFVLRRPHEPPSRFGLARPHGLPLPGLDGTGRLCLTVSGVQVDPYSGVLVPVASTVECTRFGYEFRLPYEVGPYLRICDPLRAVRGRAPEIGLLRAGVADTATASNTLVLHLRDRLDDEPADVLVRGLEASRADGAGLLVVLVFADGALDRDAEAVRPRLDALRERLPAPLSVVEDVRGSWSTALAVPAQGREVAWRLLSPAGAVRWAHDGRVDAAVLTRMLDTRLVPSGPPAAAPVRTGIELDRDLPIRLASPRCPPVPLGRGSVAGSTVLFVTRDAASSRAALERLRDRDDDDGYVAVVVDGADARAVEALRAELRLDLPLFPDPRGALTRGAGVRLWPTTLTLDGRGSVVGVEMAGGDRVAAVRSTDTGTD
ncbi:MAG TPA: hypothetical protein VLM05_14290 [Mycobacteriales bacterium]|nr:hypothetical protein [Mycobacteriales bacterium]